MFAEFPSAHHSTNLLEIYSQNFLFPCYFYPIFIFFSTGLLSSFFWPSIVPVTYVDVTKPAVIGCNLLISTSDAGISNLFYIFTTSHNNVIQL